MSKLLTAEEFLEQEHNAMLEDIVAGDYDLNEVKSHISNWLIEFAKLHVEKALQAASEQVEFDEEVLIRQSILQAYPLDLIK